MVKDMKILAIDYGKARTGLAVSDLSCRLAVPLETVIEYNKDKLITHITEAAKKEQITRILLGYPKNMDGSVGESAQKVEELAEMLREQTGLDVILWDERQTTKSAVAVLNNSNVRGKKRKAVIDTVAATIMLQEYLDYLQQGEF